MYIVCVPFTIVHLYVYVYPLQLHSCPPCHSNWSAAGRSHFGVVHVLGNKLIDSTGRLLQVWL